MVRSATNRRGLSPFVKSSNQKGTVPLSDGGSKAAASVESRLAEAADEFAEALARGERPSIEDFAGRYPEIADQIRSVLPAIEAMQGLAAGGGVDGAGLLAETHGAARELGDFRILEEIGRGGMGIVYRAEQISLGRTVALKILPFAGMLDEKQLQRFKNEARAAATLEHPHIVPVYSVGCERGVHYFAMRFIDGQSLAEILHANPAYDGGRTEVEGQKSEVGNRKSEIGIRRTAV